MFISFCTPVCIVYIPSSRLNFFFSVLQLVLFVFCTAGCIVYIPYSRLYCSDIQGIYSDTRVNTVGNPSRAHLQHRDTIIYIHENKQCVYFKTRSLYKIIAGYNVSAVSTCFCLLIKVRLQLKVGKWDANGLFWDENINVSRLSIVLIYINKI